MKNQPCFYLVLLLILFNLSLPVPLHAESYVVIGISDADTITLLSEEKKQLIVRINGVDSPERNQPWGKAAKKQLSSLIFKKMVEIEPYKLDRYGRTVADIYFGEQDIGLEMVKTGYAWVFRKYVDRKAYPEYYEAEEEAKQKKLGLWADPIPPVPPWEWRHPSKPLGLMSNRDKCGVKKHCKEMISCDEAKHYFEECRLHSLDKDGDGIPCNKLCR